MPDSCEVHEAARLTSPGKTPVVGGPSTREERAKSSLTSQLSTCAGLSLLAAQIDLATVPTCARAHTSDFQQ